MSGVERVMGELYADFGEIEEREKELMKACDEKPPSPPNNKNREQFDTRAQGKWE